MYEGIEVGFRKVEMEWLLLGILRDEMNGLSLGMYVDC